MTTARPNSATGAVYVAALNRVETLTALGDALYRDPYREPPKEVVLHLKPANTWTGPGDPIPCPPNVPSLRMGGTIGLVIGRIARGVSVKEALDYLVGYAICNDVSVPYDSHYRPAIKQRCRDGFCPIGPMIDPTAVGDPDRVEIAIEINGAVRSRADGSGLVRGAARLLSDVSQFITLNPGDLLLLGEPHDAPVAAQGDTVRIVAKGLGSLENPVRLEGEIG